MFCWSFVRFCSVHVKTVFNVIGFLFWSKYNNYYERLCCCGTCCYTLSVLCVYGFKTKNMRNLAQDLDLETLEHVGSDTMPESSTAVEFYTPRSTTISTKASPNSLQLPKLSWKDVQSNSRESEE